MSGILSYQLSIEIFSSCVAPQTDGRSECKLWLSCFVLLKITPVEDNVGNSQKRKAEEIVGTRRSCIYILV